MYIYIYIYILHRRIQFLLRLSDSAVLQAYRVFMHTPSRSSSDQSQKAARQPAAVFVRHAAACPLVPIDFPCDVRTGSLSNVRMAALNNCELVNKLHFNLHK